MEKSIPFLFILALLVLGLTFFSPIRSNPLSPVTNSGLSQTGGVPTCSPAQLQVLAEHLAHNSPLAAPTPPAGEPRGGGDCQLPMTPLDHPVSVMIDPTQVQVHLTIPGK